MQEKQAPKETRQQARTHVRSVRAIGESEEWLFTALQSIGDAVIATDAAGAIVFMNPVAAALTGWSEKDAEGRDCREVFRIVNESTRQETESPVAKVIRDGVISGLANHTILIARDGVECCIEDSGSPIRDKAGALTGVVLIFRDVTGRRRAEQAQQEQQRILHLLFDFMPVIVVYLDENQELKWVNREWNRVVGWSLMETWETGRFEELCSSLLPRAHAGSPPPGDPIPGWRDITLTDKDGLARDLSWATVRLSDGSSIGIGLDAKWQNDAEAVARRLRATAEMRSKRLEIAMRETDHRVKNGLQLVAAMLDIEVMAHKLAVPVEDLTRIRMHVSALAGIHDLLVADVRKPENVRVFSASAGLRRLLPMLQEYVGAQNIGWTIDDVQLPVNHGISLAVLTNELVSNAVKHGGRKLELRLALAERLVTLEVLDDGPGFSQEFHPGIASHFGLELVESVTRLNLGGEMAFSNRPEGGACVRITFPLPPAVEALAS